MDVFVGIGSRGIINRIGELCVLLSYIVGVQVVYNEY